jgi:hypothetical protein
MLLERAGLPAFPTRVAIPWGDLDYDALAAAKPSNAKMIVMEHQRFRFWVQARCWRLREIYPWAFVSFDDVFLGGEGGQRWRYAPDAECRGWVLPPFRWAYKGTRAATLGIVHIDHDHGTDVIVSAAADTSHYELMAGRWPLRLAQ